MPVRQFRLRVERIDMRHAAGHEQKDDVLRLGRKMRFARNQGIARVGEQLLDESPERASDPAADERRNTRSREGTRSEVIVSYSTKRNSLLASRTRDSADHFSTGSPG